MTFFTWIGIGIVSLLLYSILYIMAIFVAGVFNENNTFIAAIAVGIIISFILAFFIIEPKAFGYQKISTVSENVMEKLK